MSSPVVSACAFSDQSLDEVSVTVDDTGMNQRVAGIGPGVHRRGTTAGSGPFFVGHSNPKIGSKLYGSAVALNPQECFRESLSLQSAGIAERAYHRGATFHLQEDGGNIFAANCRIDSLYAADKRLCLAKEKTNHIQNVNAHVREDKLIEFPQKWLIVEDWKTRAKINMRPERFSDHARIENLFHFAQWTLPTPVFMNEQRNVSFAANTDHFLCRLQVIGEWLLADHRNLDSWRRGQPCRDAFPDW